MSLNHSTIAKFLREQFTGKNPIRVASSNKQAMIDQIKTCLGGLYNVDIETQRYYHSRWETYEFLIGFSIKDTSSRYAWGHSFSLLLNETSQLIIYHSGTTAFISNLDELVAFIDVCQDRLDRQNAQKSKRQKVRDLKAQAVIAQVKKMAKEDKFDFYTDTDTVKLKLYIRLTDREAIRLDIPFKRFQEILPQLRETIQSLRDLYASGIKFKIESPRYLYRSGWITHESL